MSTPERPLQAWPLVDSLPAVDYRIFTVRTDRKRSPRTQQVLDFFVIDCAHWVNVVAVTTDRRLVMVEQYRHGTNTFELEIPGGMIDRGDPSPEAAGVRELREETGYSGTDVSLLASTHPNPAIMSNTCFTVCIEGCEHRHTTEWDRGEDMVTRLVPLDDVPAMLAAGRIRHSLVVVALSYYLLGRGKT